MVIEATISSNKISKLSGISNTGSPSSSVSEKTFTGYVNRIDKNGSFISIREDDGLIKTYYFNDSSEIYKGTTLVDLSALYEGDKVKVTVSTKTPTSINTIDINTTGVQVENLYRSTIQKIEPNVKKIIINNERIFEDWKWSPTNNKLVSINYSANTPIYVGNRPINEKLLRYYINNDIYYVTVNINGKEMIKRIVILSKKERTYYERMASINTSSQFIGLKTSAKISYHNGTILIRNGRLVDASSLQSVGTALVVTNGATKSEYANLIQVTNDSFQSPNLSNHEIYYGQINIVNNYTLSIKNAIKLSNNYWTNSSTKSLSFSNDTIAIEDFRSSILTVEPKTEFPDYVGQYAYFYVSGDHIVATHIVGKKSSPTSMALVGRLNSRVNTGIIQIRNASQWQDGYWKEHGKIYQMNINQATIIKDGKVITEDDLNINDRLFILSDSIIKGRIILVD